MLTRYSGTPVVSQALTASACMPSSPISRRAAESVRWYSSSGAISSGFSGSTASQRSSNCRPRFRADPVALHQWLPQVSIAPFGLPVVPEV